MAAGRRLTSHSSRPGPAVDAVDVAAWAELAKANRAGIVAMIVAARDALCDCRPVLLRQLPQQSPSLKTNQAVRSGCGSIRRSNQRSTQEIPEDLIGGYEFKQSNARS